MKHLLLASALLLTTGVVSAEPTIYIGAAAGQATMNTWCDDPNQILTSCDDSVVGMKIFGGFRFTPNFALEGSLNNYGEYTATGNIDVYPVAVETEVTSLTWSVVGIIPISKSFELFGKAGLVAWNATTNVDVSGISGGSYSENGNELLLGAGVNINITPDFTFRAEVETFDLDTDLSDKDVPITTIMAGVFYNF